MPEKVKIVSAYDNDTFKVQLKNGTIKSVRLISGNNQAWYDGFEKNQPGFKLDEAVSSLVGKEVNINFKKQSEDEYKKNFTRELGSISTATIPDLAEHLYNKTQIYKRDSGKTWTLNKPEVQTDSLINPQQFKAVQNLLIKKDPSLQPKQVLAYKREIESAKSKFSFKADKELVDFVNRRSTVPYESLKTFQLQVPTKQSIMTTPVKNKSLKVSGKPEYKDPGKSYKTIGIDEANSLIENGEIVGTKVDQLRQELEQSGFVKDLSGYELHDANGTKYLFPIFKGDSQKNFKQALKSNQGEELNAFGNRYATSERAIKTWKDQFGISPTYTNSIQDNVTEVAKNNGTALLDYTKTAVQPFNPLKNIEKNSGFLTKNLIPPKEGDPEFKIEDEGGKSIDGFKLASSLFLNLGAAFNPEPFTSGAMNTVGNKLYRDATNTKFSDAPVLNTLDELLGYSGAIGYLGVTAPVGAVLEGGSTAMSTAKIAKITAKMTSLMKSAKNSKALTGSLTAAALSLGGKEAYNAVVSAGEKYGVNTPEFWKEVGVSAVPLIVGGFAMKKNFRNGKAAGLKTTRSLRTDFPKVTPVTPSKRYVNGVLKTPTILQSKLPFTRQLPNSSGTVFNKTFYDKAIKTNAGGFKNVKPKPATNWTTASGMKFKQGGTLKFQNGQALPYVNPPLWATNTPIYTNTRSATITNYIPRKTVVTPTGTTRNFFAPNTLAKLPSQGTIQPLPIYNKPASFVNPVANTTMNPVFVKQMDEPVDDMKMMLPEKQQVARNNRTGFGYQEANLALSVLPALLNTKVKADKLTYQPFNPAIRGIQGDPLLQQRLNAITQNKYLQNKAISSDPSQELVRRLVVNRQAMQANQEAYNVDTQARIADTQRYYGEKNAADQYNYTNKQNTDNQNVQMNNNAMMQNAAQKNQVMGQTIQNIMGYMTNKADDQNLLAQNYLVHKNQENQGALNMLVPKYTAMFNALESSGLKETNPTEYARRSAEISQAYNQEYSEKQSGNSVNNFYAPNQQTLQRAGVWKYKKGGTLSDETKVLEIITRKATNIDKVFIDSARKYNELSSKVSTEALNRGSRLVVNALNNLPKTTIKSLPFKKLL